MNRVHHTPFIIYRSSFTQTLMRRFLTTILVLVAIFSFTPFYTKYKEIAAPIPPGVHLGGLNLSTLKSPTEIERHLESVYREPIAVYFADERLLLRPDDIDFKVNLEQMFLEAGEYLSGPAFVDIAFREALGLPQKRRDVPIRYTINPIKLNQWLAEVGERHNRMPQGARAVPPNEQWIDDAEVPTALPQGFVGLYNRDWVWTAGAPGYELNVAESAPQIVDALALDQERVAHLVLFETPAQPPNMQDLAQVIDSYLSNFPGFAAVYVHDLLGDEIANVDADVSFSGMSTLKIGIVAALMQRMDGFTKDDPVSIEVGQWIDFALGESNNHAANMLLRQLGDGDISRGTRNFTTFMGELGLVNTYMQSGYDAKSQFAEIPTPGNQRTDWDANPDHNIQTTPTDMGILLTAIYECTQGRGLLLERFPADFTPLECNYILFYLSHDEFQELLWAGLPRPDETWVVHKHGFAFESHSDAGIVWGPNGPYVLSIFFYRQGWMDWDTSNTAMKDVSRITWNFFDFQAKQAPREPLPPPLILYPPPSYLPINSTLAGS